MIEPRTYVDPDGHVFRLREINQLDERDLYLCLEDWPDDGAGGYTIAHARNDVVQWWRENKRVPIPLPAEDPVVLTMMFERDSVVIGVVRFAFWFYHCEIINESLKIAERGKGYSSILHEMQFALVPIFQPQSVSYRVFKSAAPIESYLETKLPQAIKGRDASGELTGQPLNEYRYDVSALAERAKDPQLADALAITASTKGAAPAPRKPPTIAEQAPPEPPPPAPNDYVEPQPELIDLGARQREKRKAYIDSLPPDEAAIERAKDAPVITMPINPVEAEPIDQPGRGR